MHDFVYRWSLYSGRLYRLVLCVAAGLVLWGCATPPGSERQTELVTASDEPDARRRARLRLELAVGYFEDGKTTIALDELKQALVNDPSYAEAYNLRGLVYMRLNETALAEDSFRHAISLNPRDASSVQNYGWMLCQAGRYRESTDQFNRALGLSQNLDRAKAYLTMGLCQSKGGSLDEAILSLSRSYELDAGNPITAYNLSSALYKRNEFERAQFIMRRLNRTDLANAESLWLGIKIERRLKDVTAERLLADQLRRQFPQAREVALYDREAFND
jgi:type IV pilus assembly protein PilF